LVIFRKLTSAMLRASDPHSPGLIVLVAETGIGFNFSEPLEIRGCRISPKSQFQIPIAVNGNPTLPY